MCVRAYVCMHVYTSRSHSQQINGHRRGQQLEGSAGVHPEVATGKRGVHRWNQACAHYSAVHRELSQPPPLLSPQNAPHITMGSHLRPPFFGMPTALCQTPGEKVGYVSCLYLYKVFRQLDKSRTEQSSVNSRFSIPGYSFLPSAQAEMLARQQELLRKQSLAR